MKTNDLINSLSAEAKPVRRIDAPQVSFVKWTAISLLCVGAGLLFFGVRGDWESAVLNFEFSFQLIATLALAFLSAFSAFLLSVPGRKSRLAESLPWMTGALWLVAIGVAFATADKITGGLGLTCLAEILLLGVLPGAALLLIVMRAAPLNKSRVAMFALLGAAALGAGATQLICVNDDPLHVLLWHFAPVAALGVLGAMSGRALLRWDDQSRNKY